MRLASAVKRVPGAGELFGDLRRLWFDCVSGELKSNELLLQKHPSLFALNSYHETKASSFESIFRNVDFIVSVTKLVCVCLCACVPFFFFLPVIHLYS